MSFTCVEMESTGRNIRVTFFSQGIFAIFVYLTVSRSYFTI